MRAVEQALALCRDNGDQAGLITSIETLGHIEADRINFRASAEAYREALGLARGSPDPLALAHTERQLGDALSRLETAYLEAVEFYEKHIDGHELDCANALAAVARLMDSTNRAGAARIFWYRALGRYLDAGFQAGVTECNARLGT